MFDLHLHDQNAYARWQLILLYNFLLSGQIKHDKSCKKFTNNPDDKKT